VITLISGPAELLRAEALAGLRAELDDDPALLEVSTNVLDGRKVALSELENVCELNIPDIAPSGHCGRLSSPASRIAEDAGWFKSDRGANQAAEDSVGTESERFLEYLERIPETTELVLVEEEVVRGGPLLRRLMELQRAGKARIVLCNKPGPNDLPGWIRGRAKQRGVQLGAEAVQDLAEFVGDDLRQLDQELIKLADYAVGRPVKRADVRLLVASTRAANIFELVDALGAGDTPGAARLMRHILDIDGEQPLIVLTMIARQFRLLIQAKAMQAKASRPREVGQALGVPDWTASKLLNQAARYTFAGLKRSMEHILAADEAIKTGHMSDREAMDVLLAQLALT
jgi:DNA polymerase-3 subunit delta